jgi:uncharacterized protein YecE (DUF72 family)
MVRIGISGWRYEPWRGVFYPSDLPQRRELEFAARHFPTIEINGSFYSLQRPEYFQAWHDETPAGFVFSVKGSRYITHMLRLKGVEKPLANFFASGVLNLRDKLGPFLWQFPPQFRFMPDRFEGFFEMLPSTMEQALSLARRRDARMLGRSRLAIDANRPLRHAIEIRHPSFVDKSFISLLKKHEIGLVVADTAGKWPKMFHVTADFVYVRLHGDVEIYKSGYTSRALDSWARRIRSCAQDGKDVFVYFDNDMKVKAPFDALALMRKLDLHWERSVSSRRGERPLRIHAAGSAPPRSKRAYGPRVTGGNSAWEKL